MTTKTAKVTFGFPEFWGETHSEFKPFFEKSESIRILVDDVLAASVSQVNSKVERVVYALSRVTANTFTELMTLVGNGCGLGALRLSRGMFESCVMAEYLRQNPVEVDDYLDFSFVLNWNRYQQLLKGSPQTAGKVNPATVAWLQQNYNRVRPRFVDRNNRVRGQWHKKPLAQMAADVGMQEQYDLFYTLAASVHHTNPEGLFAQILLGNEGASFQQAPALKWLREALSFGHTYLIQVLDTLNACLRLGLDERIESAARDFQQIWKS